MSGLKITYGGKGLLRIRIIIFSTCLYVVFVDRHSEDIRNIGIFSQPMDWFKT